MLDMGRFNQDGVGLKKNIFSIVNGSVSASGTFNYTAPAGKKIVCIYGDIWRSDSPSHYGTGGITLGQSLVVWKEGPGSLSSATISESALAVNFYNPGWPITYIYTITLVDA